MITTGSFVELLDRDYLSSFIREGGTAVKFVVPADDDVASGFTEGFSAIANAVGYVVAAIDAAEVRVHLMDQVYFAVARQLDWDALAEYAVRQALAKAGFGVADDAGVTIESVAHIHQIDPAELTRDINRQLQEQVARDYRMTHEFRIAMLRLCQARLASGQVTEAEHAAVLDWLHGDLRQMSLLRSATIFRKLGRQNARPALSSVAHWLAVNGRGGLVISLDIRRLGVARRPAPEARQGLYYTKAALLDAYEMIRQLVDSTDELSHCLIVVVAAPEFVADQVRGVAAYQALKLRIYDEVRDRNRDNPSASLVRLGAS